jgi:hypothetical protein
MTMPIKNLKYKQMYACLHEHKPKVIMEVGTWNGTNAIEMINIAKFYHNPKDIYYYGFDLFEDGTKELDKLEINVKQHIPFETVKSKLVSTGVNIKLIKGNTKVTIARLKALEPKLLVDFVFIDGGHSLDTIESDFKTILLNFSDLSTIIFLDDYYPDNTKYGAKVLVDGLHDGFEKELINVYQTTCYGDKNFMVKVNVKVPYEKE